MWPTGAALVVFTVGRIFNPPVFVIGIDDGGIDAGRRDRGVLNQLISSNQRRALGATKVRQTAQGTVPALVSDRGGVKTVDDLEHLAICRHRPSPIRKSIAGII